MESDNSSAIQMIKYGHNSTFKTLLNSNYRLVALNDKGQTALHLIYYKGAWNLLDLLDEKLSTYPEGLNSLDFIDCDGLSHLHVACARGSVPLVERFLNTNNINASYNASGGCSGFTPLHFAIKNPKECKREVVNKLIEQGANVNAVDSKGRTPLHIASGILMKKGDLRLNCLEIMDILIKSQSNIDAKDTDGNTPLLSIFSPLHHELQLDQSDSIPHISVYMPENKKKLEFFLKNGADITASNNKKQNILHLILNNLMGYRYEFKETEYLLDDTGHIEMIQQILSANPTINLDLKNDEGETPLQMAIACMSPKIVKLLLDHNADFKNLKFERQDNVINFFYYPDMVLIFEPLQDLISILDILSDRGFNFSVKDSTNILKFIWHNDGDNCDCINNDYSNIKLLLYYGCKNHIKDVLNSLYNDLSSYEGSGYVDFEDFDNEVGFNDYNEKNLPDSEELYSDLMEYLEVWRCAKIYKNREIIQIVRGIIRDILRDQFNNSILKHNDQIPGDLKSIKNIKFENNMSLYDVLLKNPRDISRSVVNEFDLKLIPNLRCFKDVVKGHMAKARVRILFENYACDYLKVICESLPDVCCRMIIYYLKNDDILNLALAITADN